MQGEREQKLIDEAGPVNERGEKGRLDRRRFLKKVGAADPRRVGYAVPV